MANKPARYAECPHCHRQIGVQRDFDAVKDRPRPWIDSRWRLSIHASEPKGPRCTGSRNVVPFESVVERAKAS